MNQRRHKPDLSYLSVKPEAMEAYDALNLALDKQRGVCFEKPGIWTSDKELGRARRIEIAKQGCRRCPVLERCNAFAQIEQPEGPLVQGGEFYPETEIDDV